MAISLNKMVSILSDRVGQPFNISLQNQLKDILIYKAADYTRQFLDANPFERKLFLQSFHVEMEEIEALDCDVELPCKWFRSKCELPQPIRSKTIIWDFVGAADFSTGYGYMEPELMKYHTSSRYTGLNPKWFWQNNKLIAMNEESMKYLGVRGILADPRLIESCSCSTDTAAQTCFNDDSSFPASDDIINAIMRDTFNVELRAMFPEPAVIQVDKTEDARVQGAE